MPAKLRRTHPAPVSEASTPLHSLRTFAEFQREFVRIWPSIHSLNWFVRRNRAALRDAGALVELAGRNWIQPDRFVGAAMQIGQQQASLEREIA